jgi:DNA-binding GntR family transcriptional regulator
VAFEALPASRRQDQVAEALRQAILRGDLRPGERIRELHLARELGVSQTPVREAFAALAQEGLVVRVAHRGTFVSRLHARELRELLTLRAVLDAFSARLAAERVTDADLELLRSLLERMRAAELAGDLPALTEAHLEFHETLYQLSGHELLGEIFGFIHRRMALALTFAENLFRSDGNEAECHAPLIDALARRDPDGAEQVSRDLALGWIDQVVLEPGDAEAPPAAKPSRPVRARPSAGRHQSGTRKGRRRRARTDARPSNG